MKRSNLSELGRNLLSEPLRAELERPGTFGSGVTEEVLGDTQDIMIGPLDDSLPADADFSAQGSPAAREASRSGSRGRRSGSAEKSLSEGSGDSPASRAEQHRMSRASSSGSAVKKISHGFSDSPRGLSVRSAAGYVYEL